MGGFLVLGYLILASWRWPGVRMCSGPHKPYTDRVGFRLLCVEEVLISKPFYQKCAFWSVPHQPRRGKFFCNLDLSGL